METTSGEKSTHLQNAEKKSYTPLYSAMGKHYQSLTVKLSRVFPITLPIEGR